MPNPRKGRKLCGIWLMNLQRDNPTVYNQIQVVVAEMGKLGIPAENALLYLYCAIEIK